VYGKLLGDIFGRTFVVGTGGTFTAPVDGKLLLRIHDGSQCLEHNDGTILVVVRELP
jgi:hypothetical protein